MKIYINFFKKNSNFLKPKIINSKIIITRFMNWLNVVYNHGRRQKRICCSIKAKMLLTN